MLDRRAILAGKGRRLAAPPDFRQSPGHLSVHKDGITAVTVIRRALRCQYKRNLTFRIRLERSELSTMQLRIT